MKNKKSVNWDDMYREFKTSMKSLIIIGISVGMIISANKAFEAIFGNAWALVIFVLAGIFLSCIHIPLYSIEREEVWYTKAKLAAGFTMDPNSSKVLKIKDIIAINLGGGFLPVVLSLYFLYKLWPIVDLEVLLIAILWVALASYFSSIWKDGSIVSMIAIPAIISAILVLTNSFFMQETSANDLSLKLVTGYIISTLGSFLGTDLLHLYDRISDAQLRNKIKGSGSIGGAGINDGIWHIGFLAILYVWILSFIPKIFEMARF